MAQDIHPGRKFPVFTIEGDPQNFINLIQDHGQLARIMQARLCPCSTKSGSPSLFCEICHGDNFVYNFQRKLLQADEDSIVKGDRSVVLPYRIPILEPISVERVIAPEQNGIKKYTIDSFDATKINISGNPLPYHWNRLRVSYYFDRYEYIAEDLVDVNVNSKTLTTTKTLYDGETSFGNVDNAHGDITIVEKIVNYVTEYEYTNYTFQKNQIQIGAGEPELVEDQIKVDYYYAPATKVLPMDLDTRNDKESWTSILQSGNIRMSVEPWYNLSEGDLITFLTSEFIKQAIIKHNSATGQDRINEFDVSSLNDEIIDEDGRKYFKNVDYYLKPFRDIIWIGQQPENGKAFNVKFLYRPTFTVFLDNPVPNNLENKKYPKTFNGKYFNPFKPKDVERIRNPEYDPSSGDSKPTGVKFTDL